MANDFFHSRFKTGEFHEKHLTTIEILSSTKDPEYVLRKKVVYTGNWWRVAVDKTTELRPNAYVLYKPRTNL